MGGRSQYEYERQDGKRKKNENGFCYKENCMKDTEQFVKVSNIFQRWGIVYSVSFDKNGELIHHVF